MSHINITKNVGLYVNDVKAAADRGFNYVFGETNSGIYMLYWLSLHELTLSISLWQWQARAR